MELGNLRELASFIAIILSLGATIYTWMVSRSKANSARLDKIDEKLVDHGGRLLKVESEIEHMPDANDVTDLKLAIAELKGTVGRLEESTSSVQRTVVRMENYLVGERTK